MMKYIKETLSKNGKLITTEITHEELQNYLSDDQIDDIINNKTAREMRASVTVEVDGTWVGIQF